MSTTLAKKTFLDFETKDSDNETGGKLEEILWPPELMMQARYYGQRGRKRQNNVLEQQQVHHDDKEVSAN